MTIRYLAHILLLQLCAKYGNFVIAFSSGEDYACVDAVSLCSGPCPNNASRAWTNLDENGVLSPCCPAGMDMVAPPKRSSSYSVTASVTAYTPDQIFKINIDVMDKNSKYLGLLLYAVPDGGNEDKVGQWILMPGEDQQFWTPPMCNGRAVMHMNAAVKHYHLEFSYRAPMAGAGNLRFRALIKHGETNGGAFFWPGVEDLVVPESDFLPADTSWIRAAKGTSCTEACLVQGGTCNSGAMQYAALSEAASQIGPPMQVFACRQPLFSNNGEDCTKCGLLSTDDGFCFYRNDGFCSDNFTDECDMLPQDDVARFCACRFPRLEEMSGSSRIFTSAGSLFFFLLLLRDVSQLPTIVVLAFLAVTLPYHAYAHNWINNPQSRIVGLSKQVGCPPRPGASINFAVTRGQDFALEWSTGHPGSHVYITVASLADEAKLALHTTNMLNDYINAAPVGAKSTDENGFLSDNLYDKTHVRWTGTGPLPAAGSGDGINYQKKLANSDRLFFERPLNWRCSRKSNALGCSRVEVGQYEYVPRELTTDVRAAYSSLKYPWLKVVAKYKIVKRRPQDYDLARLALPDFLSPGEYIIQYMWRGYYDCFDVLLATGSQAPVLATQNIWVKTDHCQYIDDYVLPRNKKHKCAVIPENGDVTQCFQNCQNQKGCTAMNVVPLKNPKLVRFQNDVNIPFSNRRHCQASRILAAAFSNDSLVCYGFTPPEDPEVGAAYTISDDPRDPVFYSTCYRKKIVTRVEEQKIENPNDMAALARFRFGDQCISCEDAEASVAAPTIKVHTWRIATECKFCHFNVSQPL